MFWYTIILYFLTPFITIADDQPINIADLPDAREEIVENKGATLFCRIMGEGSPFIVIHDGLSQDYLIEKMSWLARKGQVVFYDQRGAGFSTGEMDSINIENYIDDLEAIRNYFEFDTVTLVGHGWGGLLATHYALKYPKVIDKMILINSHPANSEDYTKMIVEQNKRKTRVQQELNNISELDTFKAGDSIAVANYYHTLFKTYCKDPDDGAKLNFYLPPQATLNSFKISDIFTQTLLSESWDLSDQLKKFRAPVLVIHGDRDPLSPAAARRLAKKFDNGDFVLIKNSGHFPFVERQKKLYDEIRDFLKDW